MNEKQRREWDSARRLFQALGYGNIFLKCDDRPDILATAADQRYIGVEVTDLHPDEGTISRGSALRAEEEGKKRTAQGRPYSLWPLLDFLRAFQRRIDEKVRRASKYDASKYNQLWLLIVSQSPDAPGSTYVFAPFISIDDLNRASHRFLANSGYSRAYLYLQLDDILYEWSPSEMWRTRKAPEDQSPSRGDLWFKELLKDPDWLIRDPAALAAKARQVAHEAVDELLKIRG